MENPDISPRVVLFEKHTIYNRIEIVLLNLIEECEATFKHNYNELSQIVIKNKTTHIPIISFTNERHTQCSMDYQKIFNPIKSILKEENLNKFSYCFIKCISSKKVSAVLKFNLAKYVDFSSCINFSTRNFESEYRKAEEERKRRMLAQKQQFWHAITDQRYRQIFTDDEF